MTPSEQPFTIILDDDGEDVAEGTLPGADAGPTWAKHRVIVELDEGDTAGHAMDATSVSITLHFDDDVEGHALSLHFPDARRAEAFRTRLLATGVVAGALVVGVTAAQLSGTIQATSVGAGAVPAAVPARVQPLVNPRIPAEDLVAPIVLPAVPQPLVNPRIPAEDLAPAAVPAGATAPRLPASHISGSASTETTPGTQPRPANSRTR